MRTRLLTEDCPPDIGDRKNWSNARLKNRIRNASWAGKTVKTVR